jgi:hypothetical protein
LPFPPPQQQGKFFGILVLTSSFHFPPFATTTVCSLFGTVLFSDFKINSSATCHKSGCPNFFVSISKRANCELIDKSGRGAAATGGREGKKEISFHFYPPHFPSSSSFLPPSFFSSFFLFLSLLD